MTFFEIAILLLFLATISVPLANRTHLPFEIFLVAASAIISFIPGLPDVQIEPKVVFNLILPPIIFSAAYFISWQDFKFNLRPISLLAFGLIIFIAVSVAYLTSWLIPGFTWEEGFLLGAIISPTDATASVAVIKKLGAHRRIIAVLEGESMINDATALVLFRFALAAIMLNTFSISQAVGQFTIIAIGAVITGLVLGFLSFYLLKFLRDTQAESTLTFIVAFSSYLIAEHLGFSGVISTVVCGIYCGIHFHEFTNSTTRINTKASWQTLIFIINCFAFTLIGIELPSVLRNLEHYHIYNLILYSFAVILTLIACRVIWIYSVAYFSRKLIPAIARRDPMPSWQMLFVLSWANMRGIVSLAAVLAIPIETVTGLPFPHRNEIVFITYCVIVITLILPTTTLPFLVNRFKLVENPNEKLKEEALARIRLLENVIEKITALIKREKISEKIANEFLGQFQRRLKTIRTQIDEFPYSTLNDEYSVLRRLTLEAINNERETLLKLRKSGEIHNEVFHKLADELDVEELRARSLRL